jgi:antagonist of KipI
MSVKVIAQGISDTIQDCGRFGYSKWGINPNGWMDFFAAGIANSLAGNHLNDAVIEMHYPASAFQFQSSVLIGLTGADFTPLINGVPVPAWKPIIVPQESLLTFKGKKFGQRCYLAVRGGFKGEQWLNSVSTNVKVGKGGMSGRKLLKNDVIEVADAERLRNVVSNVTVLPWSPDYQSIYNLVDQIFFIPGQEWSWLSAKGRMQMSERFVITTSSDKMGYALDGPFLDFEIQYELLSSGVTFGTIQALPNGKLIILMADHQTTGGYPRIGTVATVHLPKLAQLGAHDSLMFKQLSLLEAENMLFSLQQDIQKIHRACNENLKQYYASH